MATATTRKIPQKKEDPHTYLRAKDPRLGEVIARVGPCPLAEPLPKSPPTSQLFESLVRAIVSQQLSGKAADTIFGRVKALGADGALPGPSDFLRIADDVLRGAGLSNAKTRGVKDLAERVANGSLALERFHAMDDEGVIASLVEVRGIGVWTAEMFLMFSLRRPDIMSTGDLGLRKGMMTLFRLRALPEPDRMVKLAEDWRPYRSIAAWYLWRVAEQAPPLKRKPKPETAQTAAKSPKSKTPSKAPATSKKAPATSKKAPATSKKAPAKSKKAPATSKKASSKSA